MVVAAAPRLGAVAAVVAGPSALGQECVVVAAAQRLGAVAAVVADPFAVSFGHCVVVAAAQRLGLLLLWWLAHLL